MTGRSADIKARIETLRRPAGSQTGTAEVYARDRKKNRRGLLSRILSIETLDRYGRAVKREEAGRDVTGGSHGPAGLSDSSGARGSSPRVRVTPEEGESFVISGRRASRLGLKAGGELSSGVYAEIMKTLRSSCMQRCGTLLGSRDYPELRLRTKLQEAGYPPSIIEECIGKLTEAHYLDDRRYAQVYVRSHLNDRSRLRIRHDLTERGIAEQLIDEAFEEIAEEMDPDEAQIAQILRILQKRHFDLEQADYALKQKTMAFLHRKGYEPELIRRAMGI